MAWHNLLSIAKGYPVKASSLKQIRENIEHLGGMYAGKELLSALNAGTNIQAADYDSGWFAVTLSANYTYAHGLAAAPSYMEVWHAAVASPTAGDEVVLVLAGNTSPLGLVLDATGANNTTIYSVAGLSYTVMNTRRNSNSGFYRVLAWK